MKFTKLKASDIQRSFSMTKQKRCRNSSRKKKQASSTLIPLFISAIAGLVIGAVIGLFFSVPILIVFCSVFGLIIGLLIGTHLTN
jgi:F0F1-type ATP synthase assembly protein I